MNFRLHLALLLLFQFQLFHLSQQTTCQNPFGPIASQFNGFFFGNYTSSSSEVLGRLAVGDDCTLNGGYGIATGLPQFTCSNAPPGFWLDNLIVGGKLDWQNGRIHVGNIIYGDPATDIDDSVRFGLAQGCRIIRNASRLDFAGLKEELYEVSSFLADLPKTSSSVRFANTQYFFTISGAEDLEVIELDAEDLLNAHDLLIEEGGSFHPNATIIFNVVGSPCGLSEMTLQQYRPWVDRIIWNFHECTTMTISRIDVIGAVLAVNATLENPNGHLSGQIFANNWNGPLEIGIERFNSCIPLPTPPTTQPPPTTTPPPEECTGPDGVTIPNGESRTYYRSASVPCGSTCESQSRTCQDGDLSGSFTEPTCNVQPCLCVGPDGEEIPEGESKTYYQSSSVPCGDTCQSQVRRCQNGQLTGSFEHPQCNVEECEGCTGPDGTEIPHGGNKTYYQSSSVPCGETCQSQVRKCENGQLSGSFEEPECNVQECEPCVGPDGDEIPHGGNKTYYQSSSVPCGETCQSQVRRCENGQLSGSFEEPECNVEECACTGPDGTEIPNGESKTYYRRASEPCGGSCESQERRCENGQLSGSFEEPECNVQECEPCIGPDDEEIPHGANKTYYQSASVPCGDECNPQVRVCENGVLSGSFTEPLCTVREDCPCQGPDGTVIEHGDSKVYFESATVGCGETCRREERTCENGELSGSFTEPSCEVNPCQPCVGPDGEEIPHGGNRTYFQDSSVPCGENCQSEVRVCENGDLSGSFTASSCNVEPCDCEGPDGTIIPHGQSKRYFRRATVGCGETCQSQNRRCNDGVLSGSFTRPECTVAPCLPCTGPDGESIPHGESRTYYQSSRVECPDTCQSETRTCFDGELSGDNTEPTCEVAPCPPACPPEITLSFVYPVNLFNVIVFGDFEASWTRIEGRAAIGGNFNITNFAEIGRGLFKPELSCFNTFDDVWINQLVVGGSIEWDRGKLYSGNILVGEEFNNNNTILNSLAIGCELIQNSTLLNFEDLKDNILIISTNLSLLEQTVLNVSLNAENDLVVWLASGPRHLTFGPDGKLAHVIEVDSSVLLNARNLVISQENDELFNESSVIVINVQGEDCGFNKLDMYNLEPWKHRIIWNFIGCTNMTIIDTTIMGSVLAPNASVSGATGLVFGTFIVNDFTAGSFFEFEWVRFEGCHELPPKFPDICEVVCLPAPVNPNNTQCDCLESFGTTFDDLDPLLDNLGNCISDIITQVCIDLTGREGRPLCNRCAHDCCRANAPIDED